MNFSVALCTYNGSAYVSEQLDSILRQTELPAEVVVCDDGSTDDTLSILSKYQLESSIDIIIHSNPHRLGSALNFFQACLMCHHEYVFFCDQDDIWEPDRISIFHQVILQWPQAKIFLSDGFVYRDGHVQPGMTLWQCHHLTSREQRRINQGDALSVLLRHVWLTGAAMLVRRSWISAVPHPEGGFLHDEWIGWFAVTDIRLIPEMTFRYRQHNHQQTGVDNSLVARMKRFLYPDDRTSLTLSSAADRYAILLKTFQNNSDMQSDSWLRIQTGIENKIKFIHQRASLPRNLIKRIGWIIIYLINGKYHRYGLCWHSILKDLFYSDRL